MTTHQEALEAFTAYFVKNYPGPDTIIHDPNWHAPRIFRAALHAISTLTADTAGLVDKLGKIADASSREDGSDIPLGETCRQAADTITTLEALVDRAGEWRPITEDDPAPPHDVPVLLWSPPSPSHPDGLIEARPYSTGRSGIGWSERSQHGYATHWMPLPSAPTLTAIKEARHGN